MDTLMGCLYSIIGILWQKSSDCQRIPKKQDQKDDSIQNSKIMQLNEQECVRANTQQDSPSC